jgi:hypothetical protein
MARIVLCGVALFALLAGASCAQVLGIGNPETCTDGTDYCAFETNEGMDGQCFDLKVDPENCGECGRSCKGASCVEGQCVDSDCNKEFATCSAPASASSECHGLDCVEFAAFTSPACMRRCRTSDECPFDTFCAPKGENAYRQGFGQYVLAGGHCVPSFCGGVNGTWYANGVANGGCRVGGDYYLNEGAVDANQGTCVVTVSNKPGQCVEAGRVQRGYTCTFRPTGCVTRAAYLACSEGDVCIGQTDAAEGICYQVCDPNQSGTCPDGMVCRDRSGGARLVGTCEY